MSGKYTRGIVKKNVVYVNWCVEVMAENWGVEESVVRRIQRDVP